MRRDAADIIADLYHRNAELERRFQNQRRTGTIESVDAAKGTARVRLSEDPATGAPYLTTDIPWKMPAMGATKINIPPSVGQQVDVVSENGDMTDATIDNSVRSNANALPAAQPGEAVIVTGGTRFFLSPDECRITAAKIVLEGDVHLGAEGGKLVHRKGDADSDGDLAVGSATKVFAV